MANIKFILRTKIDSGYPTKEYQYMVEVISYNGKRYQTYDTWHSYQKTAKEAKQDILTRLNQSQSVDYILDDMVIKDTNQTPYFVQLN